MATAEVVGAVTTPDTAPVTTRLTIPEVAYLLHVAAAAGDSLAKQRLLLVAEPDDDVLRAGMSSLYAHGGAVVENDRIVISGPQRVIAALLSGATRWIEVGVNVGGRRDVVHVVEGSGVVCMINRLPFGVLELAAVRPGIGLAETALSLAASFASSGELTHITVNAVGCGGSIPAMQAVRIVDEWDVYRLVSSDSLAAGVVQAMVAAGAEPGTAWFAVGRERLGDVLSWAASVVGGAVPAGAGSG